MFPAELSKDVMCLLISILVSYVAAVGPAPIDGVFLVCVVILVGPVTLV